MYSHISSVYSPFSDGVVHFLIITYTFVFECIFITFPCICIFKFEIKISYISDTFKIIWYSQIIFK